jgi:threonine dehydrogenase-like Zn-dependent dehydrogenase
MYGAGDVRVEPVPDARLVEPTDALVVVTRAAICGSDLWPYNQMEPSEAGRRMGHEFIGVVEAVGSDVRTLKPRDLVLAPFVWSDGTCVFAGRACIHRASTEAGTASTASTADRVRRFASPRRMGRSSCCPSGKTTR